MAGQRYLKDIHNWENYSIDLAGLIRQEPGAIYRVILSFRQEYSAYPCGGVDNQDIKFADNNTPDGLMKVSGSALSKRMKRFGIRPKPIITITAEQWTGVYTDGKNGIIPVTLPII